MFLLIFSLLFSGPAHAFGKPMPAKNTYSQFCDVKDSAHPNGTGTMILGTVTYSFVFVRLPTGFQFDVTDIKPTGGLEPIQNARMTCDLGERKCVGFGINHETLVLPYKLESDVVTISYTQNDRRIDFTCEMPIPEDRIDPPGFCHDHPGAACQLIPGGPRLGNCCHDHCLSPWNVCG